VTPFRQDSLPFAAIVGLDLLAPAGKLNGDLLIRLRPAPDDQRLILLHHHVANSYQFINSF
jgi:hypothetical protein